MRIGIIGAGPKGLAIATKAYGLRQAGLSAPEVTLIDPHGVAASWLGGFGYTDGSALLCTPPERDLGFPYAHAVFGPAVAECMLSRFSWASYIASVAGRYEQWVSRGRPAPSHRDFGMYLRWAADRCGAEIVLEHVEGLQFLGAGLGWHVEFAGGGGQAFDAVVVTGSGPSKPHLAGANATVHDGFSLWRNAAAAKRGLVARDARAIVIGSGGTAGAVAEWLLSHAPDRCAVLMVGGAASPFVRVASHFENRLFGDDERWRRLTEDQRDQIVQRIASGFLWEAVGRRLEDDERFDYLPGRALGFEKVSGGLRLLVETGGGKVVLPATVFVECRGFDAKWFFGLLQGQEYDAWKARPKVAVDRSFCLEAPFPHPGLHVPSLGASIGPAAGNLLALGWISDQIMRRYVGPVAGD